MYALSVAKTGSPFEFCGIGVFPKQQVFFALNHDTGLGRMWRVNNNQRSGSVELPTAWVLV